jgi:hypothetical protein
MNRRGGITDIFLFIIISFVVAMICGIFVYIGDITETRLHESMDDMEFANSNTSQTIDNTIGKVSDSYESLKWLSFLIIVGMMLSILIGSYLVTTKPIFFIPYIFVSIVAVLLSVTMANAYEVLIKNATLESSFAGFVATNYILLHLPMWVTAISFAGAIIMFSRMGRGNESAYF